VGQRRDSASAIFIVDAFTAHASGVKFYARGPRDLTGEKKPRFLSRP